MSLTLKDVLQRLVNLAPWRDESTFLETRDAVNDLFPEGEPAPLFTTEPGVKSADGTPFLSTNPE
jgi:hypothetical protein